MNIIETSWNWNGALSRRSSTKYIALHHAEASSCTVQQIDDWHKGNGWCGIGYHFFVRKNGEIYRGRPIWAVGSHVQGMNSCSIGICAEGSYMRETMPAAQKKAIAELLDYLKTEHYPNAEIVGHREIGSSDCPGTNYPLAELKEYKKLLNKEEDFDMSILKELADKHGEDAVKDAVESIIIARQDEQWKIQGSDYLHANCNFSDVHSHNEPVTFGVLGTILSKLKR